MGDREEAVDLASRVLAPENQGPTVYGSLSWFRGSAKDLARALLDAEAEIERLRKAWDDGVAELTMASASTRRPRQAARRWAVIEAFLFVALWFVLLLLEVRRK